MTFKIKVPFTPILKIKNKLISGISDYWLSKNLVCYISLFLLACISALLFLPFIIFYFVDRLLSFDDEIGLIPLAFENAVNIKIGFIRIICLGILRLLFVIFYLIYLVFSFPVYICCWVFGVLGLLFAMPMIKIMSKFDWDGNGYIPKSETEKIYGLIQEAINQGRQVLSNQKTDCAESQTNDFDN